MAKRSIGMDVRLQVATWPQDAPRGAVSTFCTQHGVSRSWFYDLRTRAEQDGSLAAAIPQSRAPKHSPQRISDLVAALAVKIRVQLGEEGCYDGPLSVLASWPDDGLPAPSESTLSRLFRARGLVTPQPQKCPTSAGRRYQRSKPNELWCSDGFEWRLADGTKVCVLQLLDDCSRRDQGTTAAASENAEDIQRMLAEAFKDNGIPQELLTDNAAAFNPHRRGFVGVVATWLRTLGVRPITCSVQHPQGNGKAERSHQTLQKWLSARPRAGTLEELQSQLDGYREYYNNRPHQALGGATPNQVWEQLPHADPPTPGSVPEPTQLRTIKVAANGNVSVRPYGTVQIGKRYAGRRCHVLITTQNATISIFDYFGTEIRSVTINPDLNYYGLKPTPKPSGMS